MKHVVLALLIFIGLNVPAPSRGQVVFGPTLSVSGGISANGSHPLLFTWTSSMGISGANWGSGETVTIHLVGPLNSLGVTAGDLVLGSVLADSGGNLGGGVTIPYDGGIVGSQGSGLPSIPQPGLYQVTGIGSSTPIVHQAIGPKINLCPATRLGDGINIDWSKSRGARAGILGDFSVERTDPEWISIWNEQPVQMYGTVAETDLQGFNQPAFIAFHDYPFTHYAHDVNLPLVPDADYQWLLSTSNFYPDPEEPGRSAGRIEWEWETQNDGSPGATGRGNIGLPLWATPTAGDRVYTVGRWSLDNGHPDTGDRSEIHPPRLLATMRKRDTAVPLSLGSACMTRAKQVDIYVSGHGGGANFFPDGLSAALDNGGRGGGRIEDVLSSNDQQTYYANGPVDAGEIATFLGLATVLCGLSSIPEPVEPALLDLCVFGVTVVAGQFSVDAGPSAFGWMPGPEERPVNDRDYDFDVPLPAAPARATQLLVQVTRQPEDGVFAPPLEEVITGTNPDAVTGLPTTAHIHLPFSTVADGIYARTLYFYWDKYNPPGRHFTITMNDIVVNDPSDFGLFNDGEFFLWSDICGQWAFLTGLDPDLMDVGNDTYSLPGPTVDTYVDPGDTLRVLTQGYEQDILDSLYGQGPVQAYAGGINLVETIIDPINIPEWADDDDLGGALFQMSPLPVSSVVGRHNVASMAADGTSYFNMDLTVNYIPAPPRIDLNGVPADFGNVCLGSSQDRIIQIFNLGEDPLDITRISVAGAGFSRLAFPNVPFTVAGGEEVDITVRFSPTAINQGAGTLTINSTDPCQPSLSFALAGTVVYPALTATASSSLFPSTVVGCSSSQTVSLLNSGPCLLSISGLAMTGTGYSVAPVNLPLVLQPGASAALTVVFAPQSVARSLLGTLTLTSNDPIQPSVALNFCGEGVPIGLRVLVLQANGTPYASVDQIVLNSYGVKPVTNASLKKVALKTTANCQPLQFHYETALPATATSGQRGSYYNVAVRVGKKSQSSSFTLGPCDFNQLVITLQ